MLLIRINKKYLKVCGRLDDLKGCFWEGVKGVKLFYVF